MDLSWLWAALIGVGGSGVGGLVGGWYVLRAGHEQWQRDRQDAQSERSRQASMSIAEAIGEMEQAIATWRANPADKTEVETLRNSFNAFSRSIAIQSLALSDGELRSRIRTPQTFVGIVGEIVRKGGTAAPLLADQARKHADVVLDAISAHIHDRTLPSYEPPPLTDAGKLLRWTPVTPFSPDDAVSAEAPQKIGWLRRFLHLGP